MASDSITINGGCCFAVKHSDTAVKVKLVVMAVLVALTAIAAVTLCLMTLTSQGLAAKWLGIGLGVAGVFALVETIVIVRMIRKHLNNTYSEKELNHLTLKTSLKNYVSENNLEEVMPSNSYLQFNPTNGQSGNLKRTAYALAVKEEKKPVSLITFKSENERASYIHTLGYAYSNAKKTVETSGEYTREYIENNFKKENVEQQIEEMSHGLPKNSYTRNSPIEFSSTENENEKKIVVVLVANDNGEFTTHFCKSEKAAQKVIDTSYKKFIDEDKARMEAVQKGLPKNVKLEQNQYVPYEVDFDEKVLYAVAYMDTQNGTKFEYFTEKEERDNAKTGFIATTLKTFSKAVPVVETSYMPDYVKQHVTSTALDNINHQKDRLTAAQYYTEEIASNDQKTPFYGLVLGKNEPQYFTTPEARQEAIQKSGCYSETALTQHISKTIKKENLAARLTVDHVYAKAHYKIDDQNVIVIIYPSFEKATVQWCDQTFTNEEELSKFLKQHKDYIDIDTAIVGGQYSDAYVVKIVGAKALERIPNDVVKLKESKKSNYITLELPFIKGKGSVHTLIYKVATMTPSSVIKVAHFTSEEERSQLIEQLFPSAKKKEVKDKYTEEFVNQHISEEHRKEIESAKQKLEHNHQYTTLDIPLDLPNKFAYVLLYRNKTGLEVLHSSAKIKYYKNANARQNHIVEKFSQKHTLQPKYANLGHKDLTFDTAVQKYASEQLLPLICIKDKDYWLISKASVNGKQGDLLGFFLEGKFQTRFFEQHEKAAEFIKQNNLVDAQKTLEQSVEYPEQLGTLLTGGEVGKENRANSFAKLFNHEYKAFGKLDTHNKQFPEVHCIVIKDIKGNESVRFFKTEHAQDDFATKELKGYVNGYTRDKDESNFATHAAQGIWEHEKESEKTDWTVPFVHGNSAHVITFPLKGKPEGKYEKVEPNSQLQTTYNQFIQKWKKAPLTHTEQEFLEKDVFSGKIKHWITEQHLKAQQFVVRDGLFRNYVCVIACHQVDKQKPTYEKHFFKQGDPEIEKYKSQNLKGYAQQK